LIEHTEIELAKAANFLGLSPSPEELRVAIEKSSADKMRELEKRESNTWVATKGKRSDIPMIGSAVKGQWRLKLPPAAVAEIETAWGPLMLSLGYELSRPRMHEPDVTGEICTGWNERESTWRKSWSCPSRGTNQSRS